MTCTLSTPRPRSSAHWSLLLEVYLPGGRFFSRPVDGCPSCSIASIWGAGWCNSGAESCASLHARSRPGPGRTGGCSLQSSDARALWRLTEGWPAALVLLGQHLLSRRGRCQLGRTSSGVITRGRDLSVYLERHILSALDSEAAEVMLGAALLPRVLFPRDEAFLPGPPGLGRGHSRGVRFSGISGDTRWVVTATAFTPSCVASPNARRGRAKRDTT